MGIGAFVQWKFPSKVVQWKVHQRELRAITVLTSFASDADLVLDWLFFADVKGNADIPLALRVVLLTFCILGTLAWIILASDGHVLQPLLTFFNIEARFSTGFLLFLGVVIEDLPQVVLTFLVEDVHGDEGLTTFAVANVMTSLYDILIKLAEAWDERESIIAAHTDPICLETFHEAEDVVHSVSSLGGKLGVSGAGDGSVSIFDLQTWKCTATFKAHPGGHVFCVASGCDSGSFFTGSSDGDVKVWNLSEDGASCSRTLWGHKDAVVEIKAMGVKKFLSASHDKTVKLWNIEKGTCARTFHGHTDKVMALETISEGFFLSGSSDRTIKLWSVEGDDCVRTFQDVGVGSVHSIAMIDKKCFVTGSGDSMIRLWNTETENRIGEFKGHEMSVKSVCRIGGRRFISASSDNNIKLWDVDSRSCIWTYEGHSKNVTSVSNINGKTFLSGSWDKSVKIWRVGTSHHRAAGTQKTRVEGGRVATATYLDKTAVTDSNDGPRRGEVDIEALNDYVDTFHPASADAFRAALEPPVPEQQEHNLDEVGNMPEDPLKPGLGVGNSSEEAEEDAQKPNHSRQDCVGCGSAEDSEQSEKGRSREELAEALSATLGIDKELVFLGGFNNSPLIDAYKNHAQEAQQEGAGTDPFKNEPGLDADQQREEFKQTKAEVAGSVTNLEFTSWGPGCEGTYSGEVNEKSQPHGEGTLELIKGSRYVGQWKNGNRHGRGVYTWPDGHPYKRLDGGFNDDEFHGRGSFLWSNGDTYKGYFVNSTQHGYGVLTKSDGLVLDGEWRHGKLTGRAVIAYPNGDRYDGLVCGGLEQGRGVLVRANGETYDGEWLLGNKHGKGTMKSRDGSVIYSGYWTADSPA